MRSLALASLAFLTLLPRPASACSCLEVPAEAAFNNHGAVFEGRVVEMTPADDPAGVMHVVLEVVQQWKGVDRERVELTTPAQNSMCGVTFEPETSWLIYADIGSNGELSTDICQRTRRIENAEEDLAFLGAGVTPVDITEEDEVEGPAEREEPAQGGCASCATTSQRSGLPLLSLVVLGAFVIRRSRSARR
jgi:hypothetical protein